ncbi:hypothetical protein YM18_0359 [Geobacter sulfurreducens]|nr:hypothetical protein YM18_0359 [Geobacter sulfurreducens]
MIGRNDQTARQTGSVRRVEAVHEMSITQNVVEICEKSAEGRRIVAVVLEIGELSGVVPEAVEFCFEACTAGTLAEGARLSIDRVPGRGECGNCATVFPVRTYFDPCPACGAYGVRVVAGEELRVKELEVE